MIELTRTKERFGIMKKYDALFIGWGKAGKTLAKQFAISGKKVAIVEKTKEMAGGTCINIACIPTKVLVVEAEKGHTFDEAMERRKAVVEKLNESNYQKLAKDDQVDVYFATASFLNNQTVQLKGGEDQLDLEADYIFINTGAESVMPPIDGLSETKGVYDSTGIQTLKEQPKSVGIIGGGNIGLEFASIFAGLGSKVTIFESGKQILTREEPEIRAAATELLLDKGIQIKTETTIRSVHNKHDQVVTVAEDGTEEIVDVLLVAVGRKPYLEGLQLENTDIQLTEKEGIKTNEYLETNVPNIFSLGDVRGMEQFTYTSLDDSRIIKSYLFGDKSYSLNERKHVPYSIFIDPPLARIGITEAEAREKGKTIQTNLIPVASMPRGHVDGDLRGLFKAVVDKDSSEILGVSLLGQEAHELINLIKIVMDHQLPYTVLKNQVFTHPTMAENLNDLFDILT